MAAILVSSLLAAGCQSDTPSPVPNPPALTTVPATTSTQPRPSVVPSTAEAPETSAADACSTNVEPLHPSQSDPPLELSIAAFARGAGTQSLSCPSRMWFAVAAGWFQMPMTNGSGLLLGSPDEVWPVQSEFAEMLIETITTFSLNGVTLDRVEYVNDGTGDSFVLYISNGGRAQCALVRRNQYDDAPYYLTPSQSSAISKVATVLGADVLPFVRDEGEGGLAVSFFRASDRQPLAETVTVTPIFTGSRVTGDLGGPFDFTGDICFETAGVDRG